MEKRHRDANKARAQITTRMCRGAPAFQSRHRQSFLKKLLVLFQVRSKLWTVPNFPSQNPDVKLCNKPLPHKYMNPISFLACKCPRQDLCRQLRQNMIASLRIEALIDLINTLAMIISNRSQPISRHKSTDSTRNIRNDEPKNGASCTTSNLVEPTVLVQFSGIGVVLESFLKDICELTFAVGGSVLGIRGGSRMTLSGLVIFSSLRSLTNIIGMKKVLFDRRIERSALH
jgi:hypothetical protein